ncbi:MAG: hypothetical protein HYR50_05505 [Candidatus Rokubacteria bacterium]|nr:hypothetical protein [Candidatus Rokubacteria bacterium]HLF48076.1 hypothetical protein [Methylomirabilota bacterium]
MNVLGATVALLGVLLLGVLPACAEPPVNFSGTWELDRNRSTLPSRTSGMAGDMVVVIDHKGDLLKIERRVSMMGMHRTATSVFYTDGRENANVTLRGGKRLSRAHWEGTSLVTEHKVNMTRNGKTDVIESKDIRRLSEGGRVLIVDSTVRDPNESGPEHFTLVFVRK